MASVKELAESIRVASEAYYKGEAFMTDADFDDLVDQYTARTGRSLPVGWGVKDGDVPLPVRMGSLDKATEFAQIEKFLSGVTGDVDVSLKWDGMACIAEVLDGEIVYALTRGDGRTGKDVSRVVQNIPAAIELAKELGAGFLRFEVVLRKSMLGEVNAWYESEYGDAGHYSNTRNAVPGLLRSSKHDPAAVGKLLDARAHFGAEATPVGDVMEKLAKITAERDDIDVEIDGVVLAVSSEEEREKQGYHSSGNPRWAVAYKFAPRERATTLLDVEWTVGRTGRVTPVARVEPVDLGTEIEFVTLHNENRVNELGLNIGDTVVVSKRGDVIPAVESVLSKGSGPKVVMPDSLDEVDPAVILNHSFSELGVKHVSIAFFRTMFENVPWSSVPDGWLKALALTPEDIAAWDGFQQRAADKAAKNLATALAAPVQAWLGALNIDIVSVSTATNVLRETGSMDDLVAELRKPFPELGANVGSGKTASLVRNLPVIEEATLALKELGVDTSYKVPTTTDTVYTGKKVVITGTLPAGISRARAKDILVAAGAKPSSSVSSSTDYLFAGENAGSKLAAAEKHGVEVIDGQKLEDVLKELSVLVD